MFTWARKALHAILLWHSNLQAWFAKKMVQREIANVLALTHAQELVHTPQNEWGVVKSRQALEIQAIRDGRTMDIIDRRTWAYPYLPEALHRLNQPIIKNTPYNIRRFSETPIPRRAINLIKNSILALAWKVKPIKDVEEDDPERETRIRILTEGLKRPNNEDSFRNMLEAVLEDLIIGGYGCIEPRLTPYYKRPFKAWAVDGSTMRRFLDWTESTPDRPKWAQMTGLKGERGIVTFLDSEIIYIRDNIRTNTPFGLGKLEVAFNNVNWFLGVQDMAGKAGADQVHKTWLWWEQTLNPAHIQTVRRHVTNELEGQAKLSLMAGAKKPDVIDVQAVLPDDLLLDWQRFLIEIIAAAFEMSPLALGITENVNKAVGQVMADADFRSAVLPMAKRIEEALTHWIHTFLEWKDLEFTFIGLEDPDVVTRTMVQQRQYMMNALTPDEIREGLNLPPLPAGWGGLTNAQQMILMQYALGKGASAVGAAGKGGAGGGPGMNMLGPGQAYSGGNGEGDPGTGQGLGGLGSGMGGGMRFSAYDVAQLGPDEIQMYQELGLMPPTPQLAQQMEQEAPGILETLSDELRRFFDYRTELEDATQVKPAEVTPQDEQDQQRKFVEQSHQESLAEQVINRRGVFGPSVNQQVRKNAERGKYPRSAGKDPSAQTVYTPGTTKTEGTKEIPGKPVKKNKRPKGHYRPGIGNQYQ